MTRQTPGQIAGEPVSRIMNDRAKKREGRQQHASNDLRKELEDCVRCCWWQRKVGRIDARLLHFIFKASNARLDAVDSPARMTAIRRQACQKLLPQLKETF